MYLLRYKTEARWGQRDCRVFMFLCPKCEVNKNIWRFNCLEKIWWFLAEWTPLPVAQVRVILLGHDIVK